MLRINSHTIVENAEVPTMYFDNDDEFYTFCVLPKIITSEYTRADGSKGYVADWDFTDAYKNAIAAGTHFVIKDEDSSIFKHGEVTYRVATKPIQNLDPYFKIPNPDFDDVVPLDTYINDDEK